MKAHLLLCVAAAALTAVAAPALAHPGGGGGMMRGLGGMSMGTSFGSPHAHSFTSHQSFGSHLSRTTRGSHATHASTRSASAHSASVRAANVLGNLNAAHASSVALQHASSHSMVGAIATYRTSMRNALALTDTTAQTNAIIAARQQLALRANKRLTPAAITRVDGLVGVSGADPTLGTTP